MSRYTVDLVGETDVAFEKLAAGSSKADAFRKAISIAVWVEDMQRADRRIFVEDRDGSVREVGWQ